MSEQRDTDNYCVWCGQARLLPIRLPFQRGLWATTMATPAECEHETLDGRT